MQSISHFENEIDEAVERGLSDTVFGFLYGRLLNAVTLGALSQEDFNALTERMGDRFAHVQKEVDQLLFGEALDV
jgi:hypothetical protein